jgi:hypothetical protein
MPKKLIGAHASPTKALGDRKAWLYVHGKVGVGLLMTETLSEQRLNHLLKVGRWRISIKSLEELRSSLDVIREAAGVVVSLLRGAGVCNASANGGGVGSEEIEEASEMLSV